MLGVVQRVSAFGIFHKILEENVNKCVGEGLFFSLFIFTQLFLLFVFILNAQKHKEHDRHKPKHKKTMDMSPSLVLPNIMVPDKVRG